MFGINFIFDAQLIETNEFIQGEGKSDLEYCAMSCPGNLCNSKNANNTIHTLQLANDDYKSAAVLKSVAGLFISALIMLLQSIQSNE